MDHQAPTCVAPHQEGLTEKPVAMTSLDQGQGQSPWNPEEVSNPVVRQEAFLKGAAGAKRAQHKTAV